MEFQVGDVVTVKYWEELIQEFGLDSDGDIACAPYFNKGYKNLCGVHGTISRIENRKAYITEDVFSSRWYSLSIFTKNTPRAIKENHIVIIPTSTAINAYIDFGYIIKGFDNGKCILQYKPTITL